MLKNRGTSYVTKIHLDKTHQQKRKTRIYHSTMTGCRSTQPRQIDINRKSLNSSSIFQNDDLKSAKTRY